MSKKNLASDLTRKHVLSVKTTHVLPSWRQWRQLPSILSKRERYTILCAVLLAVACVVTLGIWYWITHQVVLPAVGGTYTEGLVGQPQLINPLYAHTSDVDADIASLVYSGLMRWSEMGNIVPDLAESFFISEDSKTYTFTLRKNALFHNGEPVRARDILFTVQAIQNPEYRSPLASRFSGVDVSQTDDTTVQFVLEKPSTVFLHTLTVGILPADVWADTSGKGAPLAAANLQPVGSGPFRFGEFSKDKRGAIKSYTLMRNKDYYTQPPFIETIMFKFYPDEASALLALTNKNVEGLGFLPFEGVASISTQKELALYTPLTNRQVVLFLNKKEGSLLAEKDLREAIALTIDAQEIHKNVLNSRGVVTTTSLLSTSPGFDAATLTPPVNLGRAAELIAPHLKESEAAKEASLKLPDTENGGLPQDAPSTQEEQKKELVLKLTTIDNPEFVAVADAIAKQLAVVGIRLDVDLVADELLISEIIPSGEYELLLTAIAYNAALDPYPFWHSSQISSGFNIAKFSDKDADALLESARDSTDSVKKAEEYAAFNSLVLADRTAVFLYQSVYPFAIHSRIRTTPVTHTLSPSDRFSTVTQWYSKTKKTLP